jgi:hypothetical protein
MEHTFSTEAEAHTTRRTMIDQGTQVSLIAYDPSRNVYAFDTIGPVVGRKIQATTTTPARQSVVITVSAIANENETGWAVYGYRAHRGSRPRQTSFPQRYTVAK